MAHDDNALDAPFHRVRMHDAWRARRVGDDDPLRISEKGSGMTP